MLKAVFVFLFSLICLISLICGSLADVDSDRRSCLGVACRHHQVTLGCLSCIAGCYGEDCRQACNENCDFGECDRQTGECLKFKPGVYGANCNKHCPVDCSAIDRHVYCDRDSGMCQEVCRHGKTGFQCSEDCPANCKKSVCFKKGECLDSCEPGWRGRYCNISCDYCLGESCATDGYCTGNCKSGYYEHSCEKNCPQCYITGCDRHSGICGQCKPCYYGEKCVRRCHDKCYQGRDGHRHCNRTNGHCLEGCEDGRHGPRCGTRCNGHCKQNECYSHDGYCVTDMIIHVRRAGMDLTVTHCVVLTSRRDRVSDIMVYAFMAVTRAGMDHIVIMNAVITVIVVCAGTVVFV